MTTPTTARGLGALRSANRRLVLDVLRDKGEVSRADLARLTELSGTTVSSLIAGLTDEGVVREVGRDGRTGRSGRPGRLVRLVGDRSLVVGIDLGPDTVRAAVCDLSGEVLAERSQTLEDGALALAQTCDLANELIAAVGPDRSRFSRIVLGVAGVVDTSTRRVISDRVPAWAHQDPQAVLSAGTGLPTTVENDADLCVLGERSFGVARGLTDVLCVRASAGIGVGLLLGGRLYRGAHGGAGELGHVQVDEHGDLCVCGNRGCLETTASLGPVLAALRVVQPHVRTHEDLAALVAAGDRAAIRAVGDAGAAIGKGVADLCNILAPQAVVVGGDLTGGGPYLADAVRDAVERYTKPRTAGRIDVLEAGLGPRAAVLGAVATAVEAETQL